MDQTPIRILLIEDEPESALMLEAFLKAASRASFSFSLERGETLGQGLALLREREFDVVLLDLNLPDSRGLDTLKEVKARGRGVSIVVLTGLRDEDLGRRAIEEGAQDFLSKGEFDSETLRHVIRFAWERGRLCGGYEHILECSPDGVVVADLDAVVLYANPAAAVLFNTPLAELVGRSFGRPLGPEEPSEIRLRTGAGGERTLELCSARIEWRGRPAWLVTVRDVTVLKMIEKVRSRFEERGRQEAARERFLQAVAHDLRSPINVIAAAVECFADLVQDDGSPQARLLATARGALKRVLRLVESLLGLWQLESGRVTMCKAPLELRSAVESVAREAGLSHPGKKVVLDIPPGLPAVFGDEDLLSRLIANLLDNACRFARETVTVAVRPAGPRKVSLSVSDDGPGVAEAKISCLFDRFSQAERFADESGYKGTGLGLALCREVARLHDGSISAEPAPGGGALFKVVLPAY
ncbi:MAG: ATP-binding protein [Elusimicrobiota bacterium]|jgi:signal transduction histidine kinase